MSVDSNPAFQSLQPAEIWWSDLLGALAATLATLIIYALGGFSALWDARGDNDALLRLVQVRDLLAGQGWFDLTQYRMGPEGGFQMHWSRLVDAPIAALVIAGTLISGDQATGEAIASVLWPQLLFFGAMLLLLRIARRYGGENAMLPALVIAAVTLYVSGLFTPGALDHHTFQLVLTLALVCFLLADPDNRPAAIGAGAAAALMLAIGMETAPYVATGGLCVAMLFLLRGEAESGRAACFGAAFASVSFIVFIATVPTGARLAAQCDAFSSAQVTLAVGAGAGICLISRFGTVSSLNARAGSLAGLAVALAMIAWAAFPYCLGDPYAGLDPRLKTYWLDSVSEAQSVFDMFSRTPAQFASYYATPLLALALIGARLWRTGFRQQDVLVGIFLVSAVLVSFWQVRGSIFSLPLAVIPLSAWVAEWRARTVVVPGLGGVLRLLLAWLLSFNLVWHTAANAAVDLIGQKGSKAGNESNVLDCYDAGDYDRLAKLPAGTVAVISNLGAPVLAYTGHRALAGPYHRNTEGNLLNLDILMGPAAKSRRLLAEQGVDFVAFCPGNDESNHLAAWAPDGLEAALRRGEIPAWLHPVSGADTGPLRVFRVSR